ncbi:hypothetical protein [Streptomyces agglomeratus]|uniref:hypothetical protein n=1 Tax=Streptomyces agglomeratus TaxID=285458 RepID=UPI00159EFD9C|nr:hypothetical protein [Streptomyces agglomeratus]
MILALARMKYWSTLPHSPINHPSEDEIFELLSAGEIVGILAGLIFIAFACWWFLRKN